MSRPLITILDDEPEIRQILTETLEEAGFRTQSFSRAREFEASLNRVTPDVCLVDLSLPDTDGLALVHRLALEQGAAVIIISGRAQVQDRVTGLELGADDYITKPFDPAEVVARIRARLRGGPRTVATTGNTAQFSGWTAHFDRYILEDDTCFLKARSGSFRARKCKKASGAAQGRALIGRWTYAFHVCARNCVKIPKIQG